ncbi:MAG: hypothetical protein L0229_29360 [Blastocatellia bacterium]|nr:hypothetical protein [Blastocatellia bacterium]
MNRNSIMRLLIAITILGLALQGAACSEHRSSAAISEKEEARDEKGDLPEREETRQSYKLAVGATVKVSGINGPIDVETTDGDTAEVHIIRSARSRDNLDFRKITIEHTPDSLIVRGEDNDSGSGLLSWFKPSVTVRHRVTLKLPRQVDLTASGANGPVTVGEIDGQVRVKGVNGPVTLAQAASSAEISGVNGPVTATIIRVTDDGLRVSGINGPVELQFGEGLNAYVEVKGLNGRFQPELPDVVMEEKSSHRYRARIGEGGTPITISGINGSVRLSPASTKGQPAAAQ